MAFITEWFKVIKDGNLIGVVTDQSFARYSSKSGRIHICKAIDGQYIIVNDKFYRDSWMLPLNLDDHTEFEEALVLSITENEYNIFAEADHVTDSISFEQNEKDISKESETYEQNVTIDAVRKKKLDELSTECKKMIENGFDLILSDGVSHHFSLTIQDQMNLLDMQNSLERHEDVIYHADGELMRFYSEEDAQDILAGARKWKQYNLTLFNSFKSWIKDIKDISVISSITYDSEIPEEYCTDVLQILTENF